MTEPSIPIPTLAALREEAEGLSVRLARYRASTTIQASEVEGVEEAYRDTLATLAALDRMIAARAARAEAAA